MQTKLSMAESGGEVDIKEALAKDSKDYCTLRI